MSINRRERDAYRAQSVACLRVALDCVWAESYDEAARWYSWAWDAGHAAEIDALCIAADRGIARVAEAEVARRLWERELSAEYDLCCARASWGLF